MRIIDNMQPANSKGCNRELSENQPGTDKVSAVSNDKPAGNKAAQSFFIEEIAILPNRDRRIVKCIRIATIALLTGILGLLIWLMT